MTITDAQTKLARRLLGWSLKKLERKCRVGASTIRVFEVGAHEPKPSAVMAIRRAFEAAGVEFTDEESSDVRLAPSVASPRALVRDARE
jgi:ribosome-binding protein aMBF1 (putative translation factor)